MKNNTIICLILLWIITAGWYGGHVLGLETQIRHLNAIKTYHANMHRIYKSEVSDLSEEIDKMKSYVDDLYHGPSYMITLTGYHPVKGQTDSTPDITADGTKFNIAQAGNYRIVALSRDMLKRWGGPFRYGDVILIKGTKKGRYDGIYQVRDTMNARYKHWVDVLLTPGERATKERNILIYKLEDPNYTTYTNYPEEFYSLL